MLSYGSPTGYYSLILLLQNEQQNRHLRVRDLELETAAIKSNVEAQLSHRCQSEISRTYISSKCNLPIFLFTGFVDSFPLSLGIPFTQTLTTDDS